MEQSRWSCSYLGAKGAEHTSAFLEHILQGSSCFCVPAVALCVPRKQLIDGLRSICSEETAGPCAPFYTLWESSCSVCSSRTPKKTASYSPLHLLWCSSWFMCSSSPSASGRQLLPVLQQSCSMIFTYLSVLYDADTVASACILSSRYAMLWARRKQVLHLLCTSGSAPHAPGELPHVLRQSSCSMCSAPCAPCAQSELGA